MSRDLDNAAYEVIQVRRRYNRLSDRRFSLKSDSLDNSGMPGSSSNPNAVDQSVTLGAEFVNFIKHFAYFVRIFFMRCAGIK